MLTDDERSRITNARPIIKRTNCTGLILYICGVIPEDEYVGSGEKRWQEGIVDSFLDTLIKSDKPQIGSVLVVREKGIRSTPRNFIEHMGIIKGDDPWLVYHRIGVGYNPSTQALCEFISTYNNEFTFIEYYNRTA